MRTKPDEPRVCKLPVLSSDPATSRRGFIKLTGLTALTLAGASAPAGRGGGDPPGERMGVLVDLTECVGCRRCEFACAEANTNPHDPIESYDDQSVFASTRRPLEDQFTVINRVEPPDGVHEGRFIKVQCMHCEHAPCVSACLVGAMQKQPDGSVTYDASRCIGCRYCMVACPFDIPAYEYDKPLTPRVRKCELCAHRTAEDKPPACVEICPVEAMVYGTRRALIELAHARIARNPDRYIDHVYGETEGGGTSWLYLADRPFERFGLPALGPRSHAATTEAIQHGIFQGFAAPIALAGTLATLNFITRRGGKA